MSKEKQIEEMAKIMCEDCADYGDCKFDGVCNAVLESADTLYRAGYRKQKEGEWISVEDRLPDDNQDVLIYDGNALQWKPSVSVATFSKGRTKEELRKGGYLRISCSDEDGNNKKPYCWRCTHSHMIWFGQYVTHWKPLPEPPKMKGE